MGIPGKDGLHAVQENVAESWEAFCKAEGITPGVTPYGCRHTFASVTYTMPDGLNNVESDIRKTWPQKEYTVTFQW